MTEQTDQVASIGHNSNVVTTDQLAVEVGNLLADMSKIENGVANAKGKREELQKQTYAKAHGVLDGFAIDRAVSSSKYATQDPGYIYFMRLVCETVSHKLKDVITVSKRGDPVFSQRVTKQWSRLLSAWKRGDLETQSRADKDNKAAAKVRLQINAQKAALLDSIISAHRAEDEVATSVLLNRAVAAFDS